MNRMQREISNKRIAWERKNQAGLQQVAHDEMEWIMNGGTCTAYKASAITRLINTIAGRL